jgi:hypothetical protein
MNNQLNLVPEELNLDDIEAQYPDFSSSLSDLAGKKVIFRMDFARESLPLQSLSQASTDLQQYAVQSFACDGHLHPVASVDSSCALIGESEEGNIYAARVTTVLSGEKRVLTYFREGPVLFYLTPGTIRSIVGSAFQSKIAQMILRDRSAAERFIRVCLERTALLKVARKLSKAIILIDGSLTQSNYERRQDSIIELQKLCEKRENQLVGFSKSSSLRIIIGAASSLQASSRGAIFVDLTEPFREVFPFFARSFSTVTVAKFSPSSPIFRVDLSKYNSEDCPQVFSDIAWSDLISRGYPESLRLAHHLSVFDASIVASVRSFLSRNFGLVNIPSDDLRATVLGRLF